MKVNEEEIVESEEDKEELEEAWQSLRASIEDAARNNWENSYVKDFSRTEAIVEVSERDPVSGEMKSLTFKIPYTADEDDFVVLDLAKAEPVREKTVYEQGELKETKAGLLSEQELRLTGAKQLGQKPLKLSAEEMRYVSPKVLEILRNEKYPKK